VSDDEDGPEQPGYVPTSLDAAIAPDDVAAWAVVQPPGTVALKPLASVDPARLSPEGRVDALRAFEKQLAWLHAQQSRLLAVMAETAERVAQVSDRHWVVEEVALCVAAVEPDRRRPARRSRRCSRPGRPPSRCRNAA
jgi:hypothetical protein